MCTAVNINHKKNLFGRTLDLDLSYGEKVIVFPRELPFDYIYEKPPHTHAAIIGSAIIFGGKPLFFDAANEYGLAMAGLNFPGNAVYHQPKRGRLNLASFELIPYILGYCKSLDEARAILTKLNVTPDCVDPSLPPSPLHWLIADKSGAVTLEATIEGLKYYENPFGVLTNNPPFPYHVANISNYMSLSDRQPQNLICPELDLAPYSGGMGAMGLPGDFSSASRFARAFFVKCHLDKTKEPISDFFHLTDAISVPKGCVKTADMRDFTTLYTSCIDLDEKIYYFTTATCRTIRAIKLTQALAEKKSITEFPMKSPENIMNLN
jgi:choloylglycine hydrolase